MYLQVNKVFFAVVMLFFTCMYAQPTDKLQQEIHTILNHWHEAAATANADAYFSVFDEQAVFVGTDASEVWSYPDFFSFASPYFEQGKAWEFRPQSRNLYFGENAKTCWFDEVLDSDHMGFCRGSGILVWKDNRWKLQHYVLSILVPNQHVAEVLQLKKETEKNN